MLETLLTVAGKEIHAISEHDLHGLHKSGAGFRACCPVHGSRKSDKLSLFGDHDESYGFGRCVKCEATVLVVEWNRQAFETLVSVNAKRQNMKERDIVAALMKRSRNSHTAVPVQPQPTKVRDWQVKELNALHQLVERCRAMITHPRAVAYLTERGLGDETALRLIQEKGIGYLPPLKDWKNKPEWWLGQWADYLIFPVLCADGSIGYAGRTLRLWHPGMDEDEHKRLIDEHNEAVQALPIEEQKGKSIRRWRKTHKEGMFNGSCLEHTSDVVITEGAFDALAVCMSGINNVVSTTGTAINEKAFPKNVYKLILAYDADQQDKNGGRVARLRKAGYSVSIRLTPNDGLGKDWSARYRRLGLEGLRPLFNEQIAPVEVIQVAIVIERCYLCGVGIEEAIDGSYNDSGQFVCARCVSSCDGCSVPSQNLSTYHDMEGNSLELCSSCSTQYKEMLQDNTLTPASVIEALTGVFEDIRIETYPVGTDIKAPWRAEQEQLQVHQPTRTGVRKPALCTDCVAEVDHPNVPGWYADKKYSTESKAFRAGHTDTRGNWWCGHCYDRYRLMELGERIGYPEGNSLYRYSELGAGYNAWLEFAQGASVVQVAELLQMAGKGDME